MWLVEVNQSGTKLMLQFQKHLFHIVFAQMKSCFVYYDVIYYPLPVIFSQYLKMWGGWQPCPCVQARAPRNFGSHVTVCLSIHLSQGHQCSISPFLASVGACNLILHLHVVINWQLSKKDVHWPVSHDHVTGSGVSPLFFLIHPLT